MSDICKKDEFSHISVASLQQKRACIMSSTSSCHILKYGHMDNTLFLRFLLIERKILYNRHKKTLILVSCISSTYQSKTSILELDEHSPSIKPLFALRMTL